MTRNLEQIFSSFSSRNDLSGRQLKPLSHEFRNRTFMLCAEVHQSQSFGDEMQRKFLYLLGRSFKKDRHASSQENTAYLVGNSTDSIFLDFIEFIFQIQEPIFPSEGEKGSRIWTSDSASKLFPRDINVFFRQGELPYYITEYMWEEVRERIGKSYQVARLPQVICRDNEVLHQSIIEPTTSLLVDRPEFRAADEEFVSALSDYRKQNFRECVTKCCNALESVLKVICKQNGWHGKPDNLVTEKLLRIIINNTDLNDSYRRVIQLVTAIRSTQGSAHAGTTPRVVHRHVAQFVINLTGAAILLLVEESGL